MPIEPLGGGTGMWRTLVSHLLRDDQGQDVVEYALVAVVIGLGTVVALHGIAGKVVNVFTAVGNTITGSG